MPGTLFVVATPIGNLEDFTFRGRRVLSEVDLIAAEDTRRTSKLLAHYEIRKPLVSLHEHNEYREAPKLIARLLAGTSIALVSDAGTPGIADPGARLVTSARGNGITVTPIPGASAVATALSASGFDASHYVFRGFPPPKGEARARFFEAVAAEPAVQVLFEAPHRIHRTLRDASLILVKRHIIVFREITKINEESVVCTNNISTQDISEIGEFTLVVAGLDNAADDSRFEAIDEALELFFKLSSNGTLSRDAAVELVAYKYGIKPNVMNKHLKKRAIELKPRQ